MHFVLSHFLTKAISCNYKSIGNIAKNGGKFSPRDSRGNKNEFVSEKNDFWWLNQKTRFRQDWENCIKQILIYK